MESNHKYTIGQRVRHAKFGIGIVTACHDVAGNNSVTVNFIDVGIKQLMLAYAKLETIEDTTSPQKKSPPHLKLVSNNPHIQTKNFTQNVEKIENQTVQLIEKQVNHYKGKIKPKAEPIPRLLPEQGGLIDGHRATLNKLIDKYVLLLGVIKPETKKSGLYTMVKRSACEAAVSSGKDGCGSIVRMLDMDFERVEKLLKGRITGLYKNPMIKECRTDRLRYAHKRFKELGVSEETRRHYQLVKYGHKSTADFDVDELFDYCKYLSQPAPTFDPKENNQGFKQDTLKNQTIKLNTQQKREMILEQWLVEKERTDSDFDRWLMPYSTDDIYRILRTFDKRQFSMSDDTLRKFWNTQKICGLKQGRKSNYNE